MDDIGIIILAAGGSSRLGRPKQLLKFRGRSLVTQAVQTALATVCRPVVVVLGAYGGQIGAELSGFPVTVIPNSDWERGIGTSITKGMEAMAAVETAKSLHLAGTMVMLSDQPFVTSGFLNELARQFSPRGGIVAAAYHNTVGVPAVFCKEFNPELCALPPRQGAKCLMEKHPDRVHAVDFPEGIIDIDTQEDYEQLIGGRFQFQGRWP